MLPPFYSDDLEDVPLEDPPSPHSSDDEWEHVDPRFDAPNTPSTTGEDVTSPSLSYDSGASALDGRDDETAEAEPRRKPGGYESRIEQILYENPKLVIMITDAGKSPESGGKYIVYTIRTGVCSSLTLNFPSYMADLAADP